MADDDDHGLVRHVGERLVGLDSMVAVAESSTGGLVGSKLTNISGSSSYFERGAITYSNDAKIEMLGVDPGSLERDGAVSAPVARQMASGIRESAGTEWGVSTTGIAGPTGGSPGKPVGTIFVGVASPDEVSAERYEFDGSRLECKSLFAEQALSDLLDRLE